MKDKMGLKIGKLRIVPVTMRRVNSPSGGDNKMSINQLSGHWKAKGGLYYPYYKKAMKLVREFPDIRFVWIPRELNSQADELSKRPLIEYWRH